MNETKHTQQRRPFGWLQPFIDPSQPNGLGRTLLYGAAVILIGFFGLLTESVRHNAFIHGVDSRALHFAEMHRSSVWTWVFLRTTAFADPKTVTLLVVVWIVILTIKKHEKLAVVLAIGAAVQGGLTYAVKNLVARVRPDQSASLVHESSFSFPSGHTMAATVIWGIAAYFIAQSMRPAHRWIVLSAYVAGVGLVALSRVYLGAHYLSDVSGSMLLGTGLLAMYVAWITGHPNRLPRELFGREVILILIWPAVILAGLAVIAPAIF